VQKEDRVRKGTEAAVMGAVTPGLHVNQKKMCKKWKNINIMELLLSTNNFLYTCTQSVMHVITPSYKIAFLVKTHYRLHVIDRKLQRYKI
jgi:hypothetical protein